MNGYSQGDIIRINGYQRQRFVVVSKNAYIKATGTFHVCLLVKDLPEGPLHINVCGKNGESGTVICEQIKLIDPEVRGCSIVDSLVYKDIMNISDAIQGIFEYD